MPTPAPRPAGTLTPRLTAMAAPATTSLLIIGGAEDKVGRSVVLRRFVRLAGGRRSRVVVIPTASAFAEDAVAAYTRRVHPPGRRQRRRRSTPARAPRPSDPDLVAQVDAATGVFMTGGNQLKLSQYVVGTPLGEAILRAHRRGAVVAGTSAGASIMSLFMISMGEEGVTPAAALQPADRRARPAAGRGGGPALRPAGPLRPAAVDRGHLAEPARPGHRRGHRRGGHRRPRADRAGHRRGVRRRRARPP